MEESALVNVKRRLSGLELAVVELLYKVSKFTARGSKTGARYTFCGQKWIAKALGCTRETVSHIITRLSALGIIEVIHRRKVNGCWQTNLYKVINFTHWWRYAIMDIWKRPSYRVKQPSHKENPKKEMKTKEESPPAPNEVRGLLAGLIGHFEATPPKFSTR